MNSNELIDAVKARLNTPSDYALAREVLKIDPTSLKAMRERGLSDERAVQFAMMIDIDPATVLPAIQAERARDPAVKKVWKRIAESMRTAAGAVVLAVALLIGVMTPTPSSAAENMGSVYYVNICTRCGVDIQSAVFGLIPLMTSPHGRVISIYRTAKP